MSTPLHTPAKLWKRWAISWLAAAACGPIVGAGGAALALRFATGLEALPLFFVGSLVPSFIAGLLIGRRVARCVPQKAGRAQRAAVMAGFVLISVSLSLAAGIQLISSALRVQGVGIATAAWPVGLLGCAAGLVATMAPLIAMSGAKRDRNASDWTEPVELEAWPDEAPSDRLAPEALEALEALEPAVVGRAAPPEERVEASPVAISEPVEVPHAFTGAEPAEPAVRAEPVEPWAAPAAWDSPAITDLEAAPSAPEPMSPNEVWFEPTSLDAPAFAEPWREDPLPAEPGSDAHAIEEAPTGAEHFTARAFSELPELPASDEAADDPAEPAESVTASSEHEAAPSPEPEVPDPTLPDAALPSLAVASYGAEDPSQLAEEERAPLEPLFTGPPPAIPAAPAPEPEPAPEAVEALDEAPAAADRSADVEPLASDEGSIEFPEGVPELIGESLVPESHPIAATSEVTPRIPGDFKIQKGTDRFFDPPARVEQEKEASVDIRWEPEAAEPADARWQPADAPRFFSTPAADEDDGGAFGPPEFQAFQAERRSVLAGSPFVPPTAVEGVRPALTGSPMSESFLAEVTLEKAEEPAIVAVAETLAEPARSEDPLAEPVAEAADVVDEAEPVAEVAVNEDVLDETEGIAEALVNVDVVDETEPIAEPAVSEDVVDEAEGIAEPLVNVDVVDETEPIAEPAVSEGVVDETEPEPETDEHPSEEPAAPYEVEPPPSVMFSVVEFEPMRQQGRRRAAPAEAPRSKSKQGPRRGSRRRSA